MYILIYIYMKPFVGKFQCVGINKKKFIIFYLVIVHFKFSVSLMKELIKIFICLLSFLSTLGVMAPVICFIATKPLW